jgi:hypothetical protein
MVGPQVEQGGTFGLYIHVMEIYEKPARTLRLPALLLSFTV